MWKARDITLAVLEEITEDHQECQLTFKNDDEKKQQVQQEIVLFQ